MENKLKQLWDTLANYDQLPTCKYGGCTCDIGSILDKKTRRGKSTYLSYRVR